MAKLEFLARHLPCAGPRHARPAPNDVAGTVRIGLLHRSTFTKGDRLDAQPLYERPM